MKAPHSVWIFVCVTVGGCGSSSAKGALSDAGEVVGDGGDLGRADSSGGGAAVADAAGLGVGACGRGALRPGDTTFTLQHAGAERSYVLHVPPLYDGREPVPLVVDIHGLNSNALEQQAVSGWRGKADAVGFLVAYPNGLAGSWNGGALCCGQSRQNDVDDEGFLRAVVAKVKRDACVDARRVYATGLSNGGAMSHLLGCRAADLFAAIAPISMGNGARPCAPSRPLSVVMFRGTTDPLVPYDGRIFPGAQADFDQWSELNQCPGAPETTQGICRTRARCAGGAEVTLCTVEGGHVLYAQAAAQGAPVPDVVWETFARQALPAP